MEKLTGYELRSLTETVILYIFPVCWDSCSPFSLTQNDRSVIHTYAKCLNGFG